MDQEELKRMIEKSIREITPKILKGSLFTERKLTDLPSDSLQVTSRRYVNLNGVTTKRPLGSVMGQFYFDTDLNKPVWVGNGYAWVDANGTPL